MLAIDNSPSNPNTHHSHSSYPSQMEDFSTEVISLANSEMTIESRYRSSSSNNTQYTTTVARTTTTTRTATTY